MVKKGKAEDTSRGMLEVGKDEFDFEKAKEVISTVQMLLGIE